jgi:hypothetical protein
MAKGIEIEKKHCFERVLKIDYKQKKVWDAILSH